MTAEQSRAITRAHTAVQAAGGVVTAAGLRRRWELSRQRVYQLTMLPDFPDPLPAAEEGGGEPRVWLAGEVDAWLAARKEKGTQA